MDQTRIEGRVFLSELSDADPTPTVVAKLRMVVDGEIGFGACSPAADRCASRLLPNEGRTFALHLERVALVGTYPAGEQPTNYCGWFRLSGGNADIAVRDSVCTAARGFDILINEEAAVPSRLSVEVTRNRFVAPAELGSMSDAVALSLLRPDDQHPPGTRLNALIENNSLLNMSFHTIYVPGSRNLEEADRTASAVVIRQNTLVAEEDGPEPSSAVWLNNPFTNAAPVIVANNLLFRRYTTFVRGPGIPAIESGNLWPDADPFLDVAAGDLHLAPGSEPVDAADPAYAPATDIEGRPRPQDGDADGTPIADVGAHEREGPGGFE